MPACLFTLGASKHAGAAPSSSRLQVLHIVNSQFSIGQATTSQAPLLQYAEATLASKHQDSPKVLRIA